MTNTAQLLNSQASTRILLVVLGEVQEGLVASRTSLLRSVEELVVVRPTSSRRYSVLLSVEEDLVRPDKVHVGTT